MLPTEKLSFSHGFSIVFGEVNPPKNIDVIMSVPKSLETEERKRFIEESGMPDLIIIRQKPNDKVKEVALTIAKTESLSRVGMLG